MYFAVDIPNQATVLQAVTTHIKSRQSASPWFALVDTSFDHGESALKWYESQWPIYHLHEFEPLSKASPTLFTLNVNDAEILKRQLRKILRHCAGLPMLSFIQSATPAEKIRDYWQSSLAPITEDGQRMLLRFADTRINETLSSSLTPSSWARFTTVLEQWLIIDRTGTLKPLQLAQSKQQIDDLLEWKLTTKEFNALLMNTQPDALVDALSEHFTELVPEVERANFYQTISEVCALAEKHQIEAFPEVMSLALAVITSETPIQNDVKLNNWLAAHAWKNGEFDDALMQFLEMNY
jgi:hypothetical protein